MADGINGYNFCFGIYLINNSIIPNSNSIKPFSASKFTILEWKWIGSKRLDSFDYSRNILFVDVL